VHIIINAQLVTPPSSISCFRTLTMVANVFCHHEVILETDFGKDVYYRFLKKFGAMDFVEDILLTGEETGLRFDIEPRFAPSHVVDRINHDNLNMCLDLMGYRR
jgi:hypothetical protein